MTYFRFKNHPLDLLRDGEIHKLPEIDSEDFLIWFHPCYQTSQEVAYLNDLYKLISNEYSSQHSSVELSIFEIEKQTHILESKLLVESLMNFYSLVTEEKIEIIKE